MQDLMGIMCDAVVVLDDDLVMVSPSLKLDALLLRCAPMISGDGGPLPSLFQVADQGRVVQFLTGCDGMAQSLHADLRDVHGSPVRVQLFHKRFVNVLGQTRRVIGVVEDSDKAQPMCALAQRRTLNHPSLPGGVLAIMRGTEELKGVEGTASSGSNCSRPR